MLSFQTVFYIALIPVLAVVLIITLIVDYRYETYGFQLSTSHRERLRKHRRKWLTVCSVFMLLMIGYSLYSITQLL